MLTLYDILTNAQGGEAMRNLSRAYGLTPDQTQAAVEALLPALSLGLKRTTESPAGLMQMMQAMATQPYAEFFETAGRMFGLPAASAGQSMFHPGAERGGNDLLDLMFGSEAANYAVANQAAAFSGIGREVMRSMMPVIVSMIVGGLMRRLQHGGLGDIFGPQSGGASKPQPHVDPRPEPHRPEPQAQAPSTPDFGSILNQWIESMTGGRAAPPQPAPTPSGGAAFPDLSDITRQFETAGHAGQQVFGQLLDAGVAVQRSHLDAMQQLFGDLPSPDGRKR